MATVTALRPDTPSSQPPAVPAPVQQKLRIGEKLVAMGLISPDQLAVALAEQKAVKEHRLLGQILVDLGFIAESGTAPAGLLPDGRRYSQYR